MPPLRRSARSVRWTSDVPDNALTIVVPVGPGPIAPAVQRAYEHLVASDLVRPCAWVTVGDDGTPLAVMVGTPSGTISQEPEVTAVTPTAADEQQGLLELVASVEPQRMRVVALGLPGDRAPTDPAEDLAERVWRALSANQATTQEITYYSLLVPSVDGPPGEPTPPSLDRNLIRLDPWFNVLVSPEDRADDTAMAVPVGCGPSFAFHAATALASLAATWSGMGEGPVDAWREERSEEILSPGASRLVVMRSRSRSLVVPSTADAVAGMVLARRVQWPTPSDAVPSAFPHGVVENVHRAFMAGPGRPLTFTPPEPPRDPGVTPITISQLFRMLWRWLTRRLPEIARQEISSRTIAAADRMEDWVTNRVLGPDSAFRVDRRGRSHAEAAELEAASFLNQLEVTSGFELLRRTPPPDPVVWSSLRKWSFSLIDAGTAPDEISEILTDGARRVVVPQAAQIAPAGMITGWWSPPASVAEALGPVVDGLRPCDVWTTRRLREELTVMASLSPSSPPMPPPARPEPILVPGGTPGGAVLPPPPSPPPPPASTLAYGEASQPGVGEEDATPLSSTGGSGDLDPARPSLADVAEATASLEAVVAERSGSLIWRVGASLADAMDSARQTLDQLVAIVDNPPGDGLFGPLEAERRKAKRRLTVTIVGSAIVIAFIAALLIGGEVLSALLATVLGALIWFAIVIGAIWRFAAHHFQLEHRKELAISTYERACVALPEVLIELSRLHIRYQQFLDWSEVIGTMAHRPFGPPLNYRGRLHGSWVGGLHAHQAGEGELSSDTLTALVSAQSAQIFTPAWLTDAYNEVAAQVTGRFRYLTTSSAEDSDPDWDNAGPLTLDPLAMRSSRGFLRGRVIEGLANQDLRARRMSNVLSRLSQLPPDELCDSVEGQPPAEWLSESVPRDEAAPFTQVLWTEAGRMELPTDQNDQVHRRSVWLPLALTGTPAGKAEARTMAPNVESLAASVVCVDFSMLVKSDDLAVLGVDPQPPVDRVPIPPPVSAGKARQLFAFTGAGPNPELLPSADRVIAPRAPVARPQMGGTFSYMAVVDGRPARFLEGEPIAYYLRTGVGPDDAYPMVGAALQEVADASGLSFRFDGTFTDLTEIRDDHGGIWIAFVDPVDVGVGADFGLGHGTLGHGGVRVVDDVVVGGRAVVGNDGEAAPGFGPGHTLGSVLLHEIGHAMNLSHVDVQTELMYPVSTTLSPSTFGSGDRMGLWLLGSGRGAG
jgi:hypothetical protein